MEAAVIPLLLSCTLLFAACAQPVTGGAAVDKVATRSATTAAPGPTPEMALPASPTSLPTPQSVEPTPAADAPPANHAIDETLLAWGKKVYLAQSCGVCHTLATIGTQGTFGPPHDNLAEIAVERIHEERYQGAATTPEEYIRESIIDSQAFLVDGYQITRFPMPVFTNLSAHELDALVYLLMQPSDNAVP